MNVTFSENAKELSGPSSRAESRNVHGVVSACKCVHFAFYPRLVALVEQYIIINAATRSQTEEEFHGKCQGLISIQQNCDKNNFVDW